MNQPLNKEDRLCKLDDNIELMYSRLRVSNSLRLDSACPQLLTTDWTVH